jgi:class 3 adenylate cyclase
VAPPTPLEPRTIPAPVKPDGTGREADRRRVTVLFADLSGFTALAERLDPEEVRAFQNALFETFAQTIARYDGFVEKFVGDAVLAVFGAPVAHEDDPARACDAALVMLERGAALSHEWAGRLGQPVTLHVGIHTGPVVAGSLGDAAGAAYAVTGDTVNTTARLLAAAAPGTILVSETTYVLVQHRFAFESASFHPKRRSSGLRVLCRAPDQRGRYPTSPRIFVCRAPSTSIMASTDRAPAWKIAVALSAIHSNPIAFRSTARATMRSCSA